MKKLSKRASRVQAFRKKHFTTQAAFAKALGVPASLISSIEGGGEGREPSSELLLRIGNYAAGQGLFSETAWLWEEAGMAPDALILMANNIAGTRKTRPGEYVQIQPLEKLWKPGVGTSLPLPASVVRNPIYTKYVRVESNFRQLKRGDILIVDESEKNLLKLPPWSYVAVYRAIDRERQRRNEENAKSISPEWLARLIENQEGGFLHFGIFAGWLRLDQESPQSTGTFLLDSPSRLGEMFSWPWPRIGQYKPEDKSVHLDADITVLGRVIAWLASPDEEAEDDPGSQQSKERKRK